MRFVPKGIKVEFYFYHFLLSKPGKHLYSLPEVQSSLKGKAPGTSKTCCEVHRGKIQRCLSREKQRMGPAVADALFGQLHDLATPVS